MKPSKLSLSLLFLSLITFELHAQIEHSKWEVGGGVFRTHVDIVRDDIQIDSGSHVNGTIDMGIYSLTTTLALIQKAKKTTRRTIDLIH